MPGNVIIERGSANDNMIVLPVGAVGSPVDSTVYYHGTTALAAIADVNKLYFDRAGIINNARISVLTSGLGSGESSTVAIRLNNTTDYVISSGVLHNALYNMYSTSALGVPIAVGDYIEIKWTTPAWVTNPGTIYHGISFLLE